MNERIRELAEQAMVETQHEFGGKYLAFSKEKFAELIVRECAEVCESVPVFGSYTELQNATLKDAAVQIKEHFGVKEC